MAFTLLPAVDVAGGRAVRLVQGDVGRATAHGSPLDIALAWQAGGAEWIHLVDLDAAFGRGANDEVLAEVVGVLDVEVQQSGGIDDDAALERALSTGCSRVVIATTALEDPAWCERTIAQHGDRVAFALDVRVDASSQHRLAARGRSRDDGDLWAALDRLDRAGCARYVVTDVSKDGTLGGPNVELYRSVTRASPAPVIASGGISAIDDLVALSELAGTGANLEGAVVGTALYTESFTLPEALDAVRRV